MSKLKAGEWVEIRSKEEILRTLDSNGQLDGMPFMPGMFQHCGKRVRVFKRAHKSCDTVNRPVGLKLRNAVHLEQLRCAGAEYGGCQAGCLLFWNTAWLKRLPAQEDESASASTGGLGCTEESVWAG